MNERAADSVTLNIPTEAARVFALFLDAAGVTTFEYWGARTPAEAEQMHDAARLIRVELARQGIGREGQA
jgi:hypothetical protein